MPLQRLSGEEHLCGEVALLDDLNKALDKIEFNTCDDWLKDGFDLSVDYSRVQKLGGKHMQYRLDDYARRHHLART